MTNTTFYFSEKDIREFRYYLQERENAQATMEKYVGKGRKVDKEKLFQYKQWLVENYPISSANSMIVALNQFLIFKGQGGLRLKRIRTQRNGMLNVDKTLEREEFLRLVRTARGQGKEPFQHLEGNEENLRAGRSQT